MQEENSNIKKDEQVSSVVYLDSISETVSQKANNIKKTFKESKFYRNLFILNIVVFFVLLFWFLNNISNTEGEKIGANIFIVALPIYQIFISICIIIVHKIYKTLKKAYFESGKRVYLFILLAFILGVMMLLFSLFS